MGKSIDGIIPGLGERLKYARIKKGLQQDELGVICGYRSGAMICSIENGTRPMPYKKVVKAAKALGIDPMFLLDETFRYTDTDGINLLYQVSEMIAQGYNKGMIPALEGLLQVMRQTK